MKKLNKLVQLGVIVLLMNFLVPLKLISADMESKAKVDKEIQNIEEKIQKVKDDYKEEGVGVNQRIQEYEDRIQDVKRDAQSGGKSDTDVESLVKNINKDFNEWRLKRSIRGYEDKIYDVKERADRESDAAKKMQLEESVQKLEAKHNAFKAKLNDLRMTNGENWDKIENELDEALEDIQKDYKSVQ